MKSANWHSALDLAILSLLLVVFAAACASVPTRSTTSGTDSPPATHDRDGRAQGGIAVWGTAW